MVYRNGIFSSYDEFFHHILRLKKAWDTVSDLVRNREKVKKRAAEGQDMGAEVVIRSFPAKLRKLLEPLKISHLEEVRLRADQPLMVVWNGKDYFVTDQGQLSMDQSQSWKVPESLLREAVEAFSSHSLYAYEEELRQGFFTIQGGHRIGVAGKVVLEH